MFDLDAAERVGDYTIKYHGKEYTFDTLVIIDTLIKKTHEMKDPISIRDAMRSLFSLEFSTGEALMVLRDFEKFADQFEQQVKNLFGHQPSLSTTTESDQKSTEDSVAEPVLA